MTAERAGKSGWREQGPMEQPALEKILFVDDEPQVLEGFQRLLQPEFRVETAVSGAEALTKLAESGPFAVVVCDMRMPEMDGLQLLQKIKRSFPEVMRIMLTGNTDQPTAVKAVNDGNVFRFLNKPCDEHLLRQTLHSALVVYRLDAYKDNLLEEARGVVFHHPQPTKETSDEPLAEIERHVRKTLSPQAAVHLPTESGVYVGKVIWHSADHVVQRLSMTKAIAHPKKLFREIPAEGEVVRIEYNNRIPTIQRISS